MTSARRGVLAECQPGSPSDPGLSTRSFVSWVILRPLGNSAFLTVGPPARTAGSQRGCRVAHERDATGQGTPLPPQLTFRKGVTVSTPMPSPPPATPSTAPATTRASPATARPTSSRRRQRPRLQPHLRPEAEHRLPDPQGSQFGRVLPPRRQRPAPHQQLTKEQHFTPGGPGASARPSRPPAPARVAAMTLTMTREKDISLHMKDGHV
jgi:hypothetical protein